LGVLSTVGFIVVQALPDEDPYDETFEIFGNSITCELTHYLVKNMDNYVEAGLPARQDWDRIQNIVQPCNHIVQPVFAHKLHSAVNSPQIVEIATQQHCHTPFCVGQFLGFLLSLFVLLCLLKARVITCTSQAWH
jgi:hypothetical protein